MLTGAVLAGLVLAVGPVIGAHIPVRLQLPRSSSSASASSPSAATPTAIGRAVRRDRRLVAGPAAHPRVVEAPPAAVPASKPVASRGGFRWLSSSCRGDLRPLRRPPGPAGRRPRGSRRAGERAHRAQRGRQDDPLQRDHRHPATDAGTGCGSTARTSPSSGPHRRAQTGTGPHLPAPGALRHPHGPGERPDGGGDPEAPAAHRASPRSQQPRGCSTRSGCATWPTSPPTRCPPAWPAWWSWPGRWPPRPSVLLLDEPSAGLDQAETAELGRLLVEPGRRGDRRACWWSTT